MVRSKRHRTRYSLQATLVRQLPAVAGRHLAKSPVADLVACGAYFNARRDAKGTTQTAIFRQNLRSRGPKPGMLERQPVATNEIKMWAAPRATRGKRRLLLAAVEAWVVRHALISRELSDREGADTMHHTHVIIVRSAHLSPVCSAAHAAHRAYRAMQVVPRDIVETRLHR